MCDPDPLLWWLNWAWHQPLTGRLALDMQPDPPPERDGNKELFEGLASFHSFRKHGSGILRSFRERTLSLDFGRGHLHPPGMKFILSTHNVTLTKSIEDHILVRIDKLEHFNRWAVDARVTLEHDHTKTPERQFKCAMRLGVRGPDLFAEDWDGDLYAAIDKVTKKIEQQIRKRHNKTKARHHTDASRSKRQRQEALM